MNAASAPADLASNGVADFERSLGELEQLVQRMEGGELSLEASLADFERGIGLYRRCQQALEQAELKVQLLLDLDAPETAQPFTAPEA